MNPELKEMTEHVVAYVVSVHREATAIDDMLSRVLHMASIPDNIRQHVEALRAGVQHLAHFPDGDSGNDPSGLFFHGIFYPPEVVDVDSDDSTAGSAPTRLGQAPSAANLPGDER